MLLLYCNHNTSKICVYATADYYEATKRYATRKRFPSRSIMHASVADNGRDLVDLDKSFVPEKHDYHELLELCVLSYKSSGLDEFDVDKGLGSAWTDTMGALRDHLHGLRRHDASPGGYDSPISGTQGCRC